MKRILFGFFFQFVLITLFAQVPQGINYQAVIRDSSGKPIANTEIDLKIAILQTSSTGIEVYEESFSPTTSQFGLINVIIGQGTAITSTFSSIDWSSGPYFIEVSADVDGGTNYEIVGTQQMMSVPYVSRPKIS